MATTAFTEEELHSHFREECSTYGFVVESMLEETGFEIIESAYSEGFYAEYTCKWHPDRSVRPGDHHPPPCRGNC